MIFSRMNYPAASCGVSNQTEEFELLTMQFLVCLLSTLFLNIRRNALLIAKLTNGKDKDPFVQNWPPQRAFFTIGTLLNISLAMILLTVCTNFLELYTSVSIGSKNERDPYQPQFPKPNLISLQDFHTYVSEARYQLPL